MKKLMGIVILGTAVVALLSSYSLAKDQVRDRDRDRDQLRDGSCQQTSDLLFSLVGQSENEPLRTQLRDRDRARDQLRDGSCQRTFDLLYSLVGQSEDEPLKTQLRDRTCTQTCDPAQDCDGNQIQRRPRTRQNWNGEDEAELEFLLWLRGF